MRLWPIETVVVQGQVKSYSYNQSISRSWLSRDIKVGPLPENIYHVFRVEWMENVENQRTTQ